MTEAKRHRIGLAAGHCHELQAIGEVKLHNVWVTVKGVRAYEKTGSRTTRKDEELGGVVDQRPIHFRSKFTQEIVRLHVVAKQQRRTSWRF